MTLNYVTLTLDLYDGQGNYPVSGTASFTPSAVLTDAGVEIIGQQPVICSFRPGGVPSVSLLATDNSGPAPAGWTWSITFSGVTGAPSAFSFFLPFTGGASQLLSNLIPVSSGTAFQAYMPLPTGTPSAGQVPVATGSGETSAWGSNGVTGVTAADTSVVTGGTAAAPTVRTGTLDVIAAQHPAAADWSNNSHKITSLANGSGAQDAAAYGQTLAGGAGAPLTTLGDILYENATPAPARLPGNTSATPAVLMQTGTGSVSAAPAWTAVNAASGVPGLDSAQRLATPAGASYSSSWASAPSYLLPSPGPVSRRPAWRANSFQQIFQSGHGWTATGSGVGSSSLNDTSTFIKGTQCASVTTAANGLQANLRITAGTSVSMTGQALRLTFKIDNVTHLSQVKFYVGTSSFANFFNWVVHTHSASAQNIVQSGEWVSLTIPWANVQGASGSYSISSSGVPSVTSGFTDMQFAVFDDGAGAITAHLQAVEIIPGTVTTFPGGVISIVFDDSFQNAYDNGRPPLDTYGYRPTLYTIAQNIGSSGTYQTIAELQQLQAVSGWEIGGHAYSSAAHAAGYNTLTALQVEDEMRYMRAWMLANGFPLDNFAYPQGNFSATTDNVPIDQICGQYFASARTIISETAETFAPAMPYRLRSITGVSSFAGATPVSQLTATGGPLDRCQLDGSWYIITLHQVVTSGVTASTMILQSDLSTLLAAINSRSIPVLPVGDVLRNYS